MSSPRGRTSLWFVVVAGVIVAVLSWLTVALLRLDHDERDARRQAAVQERFRLALWRMDSWLSPQLALESMRPASQFQPFPSAGAAWTQGFSKIGADQVRVQSPLLGAESALFPLHFEIGPRGFCSPQVPLGNDRDVAEANGIAGGVLDRAGQQLQQLQQVLSTDALAAKVAGAESGLALFGCNLVQADASPQLQQSVQEFNNRQMLAKSNVQALDNNYAQLASPMVGDESIGPLVPVWIDASPDQLVYARRVRRGEQSLLQGVLVDWGVLQRELLGLVGDLFDDAIVELHRCEQPDAAQQPSMLASVPARLVADYRGAIAASDLPITTILWTTWGVTLLGLAVLGFTLRTAIGFGERRARFASAVTHELRTPLTTFRMYSEMLVEGVVKEPAAQREYLQTLQRESDRLSRVVENVLAWSRLEEGRFASRRERVRIGELLERVAPTLAQRLGEVELELDLQADEAVRSATVETDEDAVGQVLFNLIDNAAKYARAAADRTVRLQVRTADGKVLLTVCDHGPGVDEAHRKGIFVPFDRGAVRASSNDVPGVGLGLPLARGLARDLGGDLRLVDNPGGGACFVLELPRA